MLYRSDKVSDSIEEWEVLIVDFAEYADQQNAQKRLSIYQLIYSIQDDVYRIKSVLDSLHKKPGMKTTLKQGMILEIHTKLSHKINNSELINEFKRERKEALNDMETQVDLMAALDRPVKNFDGLSESENSKAVIGEVESLINKTDSRLNEYEDWSAKHLFTKSSGSKRRFRKRAIYSWQRSQFIQGV